MLLTPALFYFLVLLYIQITPRPTSGLAGGLLSDEQQNNFRNNKVQKLCSKCQQMGTDKYLMGTLIYLPLSQALKNISTGTFKFSR